MKFGYNKKIKTAILAGIITASLNFSMNNVAFAVSTNSFNLSNTFCERIAYGDPNSYSTGNGNDYMTFLVYSPTDVAYGSNDFFNQFHQYGTLKGGQLYIITTIDGSVQFSNGHLDGVINDNSRIISMGNAQDIFGEGITEDEIKDLIANVEGDQTVDGNQGWADCLRWLYSFLKQAVKI